MAVRNACVMRVPLFSGQTPWVWCHDDALSIGGEVEAHAATLSLLRAQAVGQYVGATLPMRPALHIPTRFEHQVQRLLSTESVA